MSARRGDEIGFEDRLSPQQSLSAADRAWLRGLSPALAQCIWREIIGALGLDADTVWRLETGRDRQGWLPTERERFDLWKLTSGDTRAADRALTRRAYVRHLIAGGRIGVGDEVVA